MYKSTLNLDTDVKSYNISRLHYSPSHICIKIYNNYVNLNEIRKFAEIF